MRATLGGGFSRLARIKKQVERELAGVDTAPGQIADPVATVELLATLQALFDKQWKALEAWEQRSLARLEAVPPANRKSAAKAKGGADAISAQADRLEAVERRLLAAIDKMQALAKVPTAPPQPRVPTASGELGDVPPAWARQAAAAATAALDGRLQSIVRDAAAAFDMAAQVAREAAGDASIQMQMARSTLTKAAREQFASAGQSAALDGIRQTLQTLQAQVGDGFSAAAANADRRAVAVRDVIIAMTEIEMAQCEMVEAAFDPKLSKRRPRFSAGKT